MTGVLLQIKDKKDIQSLSRLIPSTKIWNTSWTMPEGLEMKVNSVSPESSISEDEAYAVCNLQKNCPIQQTEKGRYMLMISSLLLFFITAFVVLMRTESVIYFRFNKSLYLYSIIAAFFLLSRYFFAVFYREVPIDTEFTPGVSIIIPCFNEEEWIPRTIQACINQDYPVDRLEVIVVDDCSTDKSAERIKEIIHRLYQESEGFETKERLHYIIMDKNKGKREALAQGVFKAKHVLVVFVDSDCFLDPFAIRNLVQPFKDPKMAGVSGRTDVANTYTNTLTKIQSVRYHIAFRVMKAAEGL